MTRDAERSGSAALPPTEARLPQSSGAGAVAFNDTSYGFLKRLHFIRDVIKRHPSSALQPLRILDVGCGTGNLVAYPLAIEGHQVTAIDLHAPSIDYARERFGDMSNLKFDAIGVEDCQAASFDIVICSEVLEHVRPVEPFFAAVRRTLRPGGALIATVPNGIGPFEWQNWVWRHLLEGRWLHRHLYKWYHRRPRDLSRHAFLTDASPHVNFFRMRDIVRLAERHGMRVRRYRGRTFACGFIADRFFFIPGLTRANNWLADVLPAAFVSGWMFELEDV